MTRPWIKPVIASFIVVAVAVGAVFAGMWIARPAESTVAPGAPLATVPAEVVGADRGESGNGDLIGEPSDPLGTVKVVEEPYEGLTPEATELLAAMSSGDDPFDAISPVATSTEASDYGISLFSGADDPCATVGDDDCPEGLSSTVLALYGSESLEIRALATPPSYASDPSSEVVCPTQDASSTAVTLGVATNKPTTLSIAYWPAGSPGYGPDTVRIEVPLDPAEEADWTAHSADRNTLLQSYWVQHCVRIEGLDAATSYAAAITATTSDGDDVRTLRTEFSVQGGERPATEVIPALGSNVLYVTTYHEADVEATITARTLTAGETASCDGTETNELRSVAGQEVTRVDFAWLREYGYGEQFVRRTSVAYFVPEGTYLAICVSQQKADAPSWLDDNPLRAERFLVTAPDQTVPNVSIRAVVPRAGAEPDQALIGAATVDGQLCGLVVSSGSGSGYDPADFTNTPLCDSTARRIGMIASGSAMAISTQTRHGSEANRGVYVIDLSAQVCTGACPILPDPSTYSIPLGAREAAEGTVVISVTWEQGNTTGRSAWQIDELPSTFLPDVVPDTPRLDTAQVLRAMPYLYGLTIDHVNVFTTLVPDRPVDYVATLLGDCTVNIHTALARPTVTELRGSTSGPVSLEFGNVCFGSHYGLQVQLTDASGAVTVYSSEPGADERWLNARATTPPLAVPVDYSFTMRTLPSRSDMWVVNYAELWIDGHFVATIADEGTCLGAQDLTVSATDAVVQFASDSTAEIQLSLYLAEGTNRTGPGGVAVSECTDIIGAHPVSQRIPFSLDARVLNRDPFETVHSEITSSRFYAEFEVTRIPS